MLSQASPAPGRVLPRPGRGACALLAFPAILLGALTASALNAEPGAKAEPPGFFWFDRQRAAVGAAAQMVAVREPLTVWAMRRGGVHNAVWTEYEQDRNRVPPLNPVWLTGVNDKRAFFDTRPRASDELPEDAVFEEMVYSQALVQARDTAPELFANEAHRDENRVLTIGHLFREPGLYRGKVVHMEGRLVRVRMEKTSKSAQAQGLDSFYEGWVFTESAMNNPVCVVFPQLPEGLDVADKMDRLVAFDGYFFKKYPYASDKGVRRTTLLFVAPTLQLKGPPRGVAGPALGSLGSLVVYIAGGVIAVTLVLVIGISLLFRRNDAHVRRRLAEVQATRAFELGFGEPDEPAEPTRESGTDQAAVRAEAPQLHNDNGQTGVNGTAAERDTGSHGP
jgi:hypothetical protein